MCGYSRSWSVVLLAVLASMVIGCDRSGKQTVVTPKQLVTSSATDGRLTIYTTFYASLYFAERIAGDAAKVVCPLPTDADPIEWQPTREQIAEYQRADVILVNGAGFERWIATAALPESRVVDLSASFSDSFITFETMTHQHGSRGAHTHEGIDGHTWMDPVQAKAQVRAIVRALRQRRPDQATLFEQRANTIERELDELDAGFRRVAEAANAINFIASHPAYNYLARRYGLGVVNLSLEPESEPGLEELASIAAALERRPNAKRHVLLWESKPSKAVIEAISGRFDVVNIVVSPGEMLAAEDAAAGMDYMGRMRANLEAMMWAIGEGAN